MSYFDDVTQFHLEVLKVAPSELRMLPMELMDERIAFIREELAELQVADEVNDLVGVADALADIVYVALGTAYLMGLPFDDIWAAVQKANMAKQLGQTKRGNAIDAVKPEGWVGPEKEIAEVIARAS